MNAKLQASGYLCVLNQPLDIFVMSLHIMSLRDTKSKLEIEV